MVGQNHPSMNHRGLSKRSRRWAWCERRVSPVDEHFELRYGSAADSDWAEWVPVARVGVPTKRTFGVEFIIDQEVPNAQTMKKAVAAELDFYLVTKGELNPWAYALYHCGTSSNISSNVHWSFYPAQRRGLVKAATPDERSRSKN